MILALFLAAALFPPAVTLTDSQHTYGWGNACVVGPGYVVTAKHVVGDHTDIMWSSGEVEHPATVVRPLGKLDLSVLRLQGVDSVLLPVLRIAKHGPRSGDRLHWAARGFSDDPWLVFGNALGPGAEGDYLVDGLSWPGMSGACVVNADNEIIGIITATAGRRDSAAARGLMVFIPIWGRKL